MKTLVLTEVQMLKYFQENKGLYNNKLKKKKNPTNQGNGSDCAFLAF